MFNRLSPRLFSRNIATGGSRSLRLTHHSLRNLSTTIPALSAKHSSDSYAKEVDSTPAADNTVHRVDPDSEAVQRPLDPPSGQWSRAGVQTEEYRSVEGADKQPYAAKDSNQGRYGSRPNWKEEKGPETSGKDEGPSEKSSHGRSG